MPPEHCDNHDKTMGRIFDEINKMKVQQQITNTKMDIIVEFKKEVHDIVYGDRGKDGLMTKVATCFRIQTMQWAVIGILITAFLVVGGRALLAKGEVSHGKQVRKDTAHQ